MERDVRYLTVGLVVLLLIAGFLGFAAWQAGSFGATERERYTILFEGGVGGLNKGSGVRYRGVEVGRVAAVRLASDRPDAIGVDIAIQPHTPITEDTVARIKPKGITGLSYIELTTPAQGPPPPRKEGQPYRVIQARPSQLDRVMEDLPQVAGQVARIADRLDRLLSEDNIDSLSRTLDNAGELSARLNRLAGHAEGLVGKAEGTLGEVDRTAKQARETLAKGQELVPRLRDMVPEVEATLAHMRSLSARLDRLSERHEGNLDRFAGEGLTELRRFLRDGRGTLAEIRALASELRSDPSQLVYPKKSGGMEIPQ
ncbi:MAG TPA: MlaD family protein [Gammaproteobacteria bacterium]|nr:MlaD family protein [Gammaproteobacteria bacterium]